ncbi:anti-anti-sigma factor [Allopseudospirillum japonicum]|uniref:Anti-sigma factor antagonist n=1 Tax=Allopseudospirillum japonicum TaxID=64971 RepID=A0A1H6S910_9GAMM|nr:STAS domain-containing protein [Allopseudospirillum japonicum]SEI60490.1 anti-anti-sigma factor [Allopseudospirillum japonicum]
MSVSIHTQTQGQIAKIKLKGRFNFSAHREFRDAYTSALTDAQVKSFEIDMQDVDYIDSSALGMLLLLKERADAERKEIQIVRCSPVVLDVFKVANFKNLFKIS